MHEVEQGFRKRNVRLVRLEVRTLNAPAQKLYESLGYTISQNFLSTIRTAGTDY